ncbi:MAG TPA: serine/threonine protein kinase, partial [Solirubrobacterales bacterium]|nr:serine/threonine protein kinase [Solirubrobacterales bacterium]
VLLYEMLTGEVPFHAETQVGVAMKHVNEPLPAVETRRPEVSAALAAVIEKATAKDPEQRYATIAAMLRDLEAALEVEVSRAGRSTGEVTSVLDSVPAPRRQLFTRRRVSWAGILLVLVGAAAAVAIVAFTGEEERPKADGEAEIVRVEGADDFDPEGDDAELTEDVELAIDGNPTGTGWTTEHYDTEAFGNLKSGVGLVVDAGQPVDATGVEIRSTEGGWALEVYGAASGPPTSLADWGTPIGSAADVSTNETVDVSSPGKLQYYLIWIIGLAESTDEAGRFRVEISDVRLVT